MKNLMRILTLKRQKQYIREAVDAQDRRDVRKQGQDKTVNLHSRINVRYTPHSLGPVVNILAIFSNANILKK